MGFDKCSVLEKRGYWDWMDQRFEVPGTGRIEGGLNCLIGYTHQEN